MQINPTNNQSNFTFNVDPTVLASGPLCKRPAVESKEGNVPLPPSLESFVLKKISSRSTCALSLSPGIS